MKKTIFIMMALFLCSALHASEIKVGLSAATADYKIYSTDMNVGVQVGDTEDYKAELTKVFGTPALAPQDEESLKFGILAGFVLANLGGDFSDQNEVRANFLLGMYALYALTTQFMLMPELFYIGMGSKFTSGSFSSTSRINYLLLPIMLMYAITTNFMVGAGPYFGLVVSAHEVGDNFKDDIKDFVNGFDFGVKLGAYYQVSQYFTVGLGYLLGLTNIVEDQSSESFKEYNRTFMITACISLALLTNR